MHGEYLSTSGTGVFGLELHPSNFGNRLTATSALFEYCRCVGIKIRVVPFSTAASTSAAYAVSYIPGTLNAAPSSFENVLEEQNAWLMPFLQTTPQFYKLNRAELLGDGQFKWWRRNGDTIDNNLSIQGTFHYCCNVATATSMFMLMTLEYEFSGPSSASFSSPAMFDMLREQDPEFVKRGRLERKLLRDAIGNIPEPVAEVDEKGQTVVKMVPKSGVVELRGFPPVVRTVSELSHEIPEGYALVRKPV